MHTLKQITFAFLTFVVVISFSTLSRADEVLVGQLERIQTRGVSVPIYAVWNKTAVASVVLYSGGGGGFGKIGADGWPSSMNFLIRSAKLFSAHPFNVILVGRATDVPTLDGLTRTGNDHDIDNQAIFRSIKAKSSLPMWLVGTSMGTISATAAGIRDSGSNIAGIVLTSSVTSYRVQGAVKSQDLARIKVPVLVLHHKRDACKICTPYEAEDIADGLKNAPIKKTLLVSGGEGASGNPCEALHYHGFIGMEKEAVDLIANWIVHPSM
jgi:pimeloyl-ACP methyl ester carboxylesterase